MSKKYVDKSGVELCTGRHAVCHHDNSFSNSKARRVFAVAGCFAGLLSFLPQFRPVRRSPSRAPPRKWESEPLWHQPRLRHGLPPSGDHRRKRPLFLPTSALCAKAEKNRALTTEGFIAGQGATE